MQQLNQKPLAGVGVIVWGPVFGFVLWALIGAGAYLWRWL